MNEATFTRLSFRERGHFSNHFTLNPVLSLSFGPDRLGLERRSGTTSHPYNTLSADIVKTFVAKGYGKAAHAYIPQTLVKLSGPGLTCAFDLSQQFPDFRNPEAVLFMIKTHLTVGERAEALAAVKRRHLIEAVIFFGVLVFAGLVARTYGI